MTKNREFWCEWKRDFIAAWRSEMNATEEFWSLMQDLTPLQMRLIREACESVAGTAYHAAVRDAPGASPTPSSIQCQPSPGARTASLDGGSTTR